MYKIAVIGDRESVYGFSSLGIDIYPAYSAEEAESLINKLAEENYAVIYITEALANGEKVALTGFGTFEVKERAARVGINPQTKAQIEIPASKAPVFKAGNTFKGEIK